MPIKMLPASVVFEFLCAKMCPLISLQLSIALQDIKLVSVASLDIADTTKVIHYDYPL